jgi:Ca2+-transporting ATPase
VAAALATDPKAGLSVEEAARRLARHGPNQLKAERRQNPLLVFARQFADMLIGLLAVAVVVSAWAGEWHDAVLIGLIVLANGAIGYFHERKAEQAVAALSKLTLPTARVWRDGSLAERPAVELVPGDLIELRPGAVVPADGRLAEAAELQTAEAPLTGESQPVEKQAEPAPADAPLPDRVSMVYAGTAVTAGHARAIVTATGMKTELGKIASLLETAKAGPTPLQARLTQLGRTLALAVLVVCGVVFGVGVLRGQTDTRTLFLVAVSLAVAAVPEGLPAVISVTLALGSQRMAQRKAIVRQLAAVETLGSVDCICSDKTGTLTEGRMAVAEVVPAQAGDEAEAAVLRAAVLCNDARMGDDGQVVGSPTEAALLTAAADRGLDPARLREEAPREAEFPFSSARKRMSTVHRQTDGGRELLVKGAVESVLERSAGTAGNDGQQSGPNALERLSSEAQRLAGEGRRVLGVARRRLAEGDGPADAEAAEQDLECLGLVALADPVRPEAAESIARCRSAGIRPVMITGDHPQTAKAVAEELGLWGEGDEALTGKDLEALNDEELAARVGSVAVYARVSPEHKLRIVRAHQGRGSVVAMTGDGVNDAPALKQADIGVAMGITGTDVSKEAARMVLADDNFATIVAAVEEGRVVYDNIRKFVRYLLTTNCAEVILLLTAVVLGLPVPLLPVHLLWINLLSDGLPALALGFEPPERGVMARPPRGRDEGLLSGRLAWEVALVGLLMAGSCLGLYLAYLPAGQAAESDAPLAAQRAYARTMAFLTLSMFQLVYVLGLRSSVDSVFRLGLWSNYRLTLAVAAGTVLQLAVVYVPPLADVFHTTPLKPADLGIALATSTLAFWAIEGEKLARRAWGGPRGQRLPKRPAAN